TTFGASWARPRGRTAAASKTRRRALRMGSRGKIGGWKAGDSVPIGSVALRGRSARRCADRPDVGGHPGGRLAAFTSGLGRAGATSTSARWRRCAGCRTRRGWSVGGAKLIAVCDVAELLVTEKAVPRPRGEPLTLAGHRKKVFGLAYSRDGKRPCSWGTDGMR